MSQQNIQPDMFSEYKPDHLEMKSATEGAQVIALHGSVLLPEEVGMLKVWIGHAMQTRRRLTTLYTFNGKPYDPRERADPNYVSVVLNMLQLTERSVEAKYGAGAFEALKARVENDKFQSLPMKERLAQRGAESGMASSMVSKPKEDPDAFRKNLDARFAELSVNGNTPVPVQPTGEEFKRNLEETARRAGGMSLTPASKPQGLPRNPEEERERAEQRRNTPAPALPERPKPQGLPRSPEEARVRAEQRRNTPAPALPERTKPQGLPRNRREAMVRRGQRNFDEVYRTFNAIPLSDVRAKDVYDLLSIVCINLVYWDRRVMVQELEQYPQTPHGLGGSVLSRVKFSKPFEDGGMVELESGTVFKVRGTTLINLDNSLSVEGSTEMNKTVERLSRFKAGNGSIVIFKSGESLMSSTQAVVLGKVEWSELSRRVVPYEKSLDLRVSELLKNKRSGITLGAQSAQAGLMAMYLANVAQMRGGLTLEDVIQRNGGWIPRGWQMSFDLLERYRGEQGFYFNNEEISGKGNQYTFNRSGDTLHLDFMQALKQKNNPLEGVQAKIHIGGVIEGFETVASITAVVTR